MKEDLPYVRMDKVKGRQMSTKRDLKMDSAALAAQTILESSGETYRAEETALRMCRAFGLLESQIMAFPTGFVLSALSEGTRETRVCRISERSIRLDRIDEVNAISRRTEAAKLDAEGAFSELTALRERPGIKFWLSCLFYGLSAAFFSVMFGGLYVEFLLALVIGFLVQTAQIPLVNRQVPSQLRPFLLGFFAAITALLALRLLPASQEAVITGVIMPLLPGLAMTNAVRDSIRGDIISGLARGADALIASIMLSAGVAVALLVRGMIWMS